MKQVFVLSLALILIASCQKQKDLKILRDSKWKAIVVDKGNQTVLTSTSGYEVEFMKKDFSTFLDVNRCGGSYRVPSANRISFDPINCTEACCDGEFATSMLEQFTNAKRYDLNDDTLYISSLNGFVMLVKL
jgi:heat shock protein HslJ